MRGRIRSWLHEWLKALRVGLYIALCSCPPGVFAQDNTVDTQADELVLEEVTVTGSRIKRRDFSSPSPLLTISHDDFEFSGQPTLEEYLNQLPQVQPDLGRTANNPGDGTARINLRGLGAGRTLVLLNGRRLAPSGVGNAVDVNNLPRSLIERVEILTGGASTVYGSDAIAGVVNFIMRQDFDGLGFDSSYSVTGKGDSDIYDANLVFGHNLDGGRGNITLYAGYYERKPTFAADRNITRIPYFEDWDTGQLVAGGSSFIPAGIVFFPQADLGNGPVFLSWNPDGTPRAFDPDNDRYNYAPVNYLQTPLTRYTAGLQATFSVADHFEAYFEAAYTRNEARQNLAPAPGFGFFFVNTDNPLLTPETRQIFEQQMAVAPGLAGLFMGRRMLEFGPRVFENNRDYTRLVAGLRGRIGQHWEMDAWVTFTDASGTEHLLNAGSVARFAQGLLVDPLTGGCVDPSGGCVPLDVFGEGRLSAEAVDFIRVPSVENRTGRTQTLASVVLSGAPFAIWSGPVDMAFGAEWRRDKAHFKADDALFTGDVLGFVGEAPVAGTERVFELYSEAVVPLIERSDTGHYLGLELGVRFSDYKNSGSVWTYKGGLEWQPTDSLRFRGMFQHSVRAPNNAELFTEQSTVTLPLFNNSSSDPCSASNDPVGSGNEQKCLLQGLAAGQIGVFEATPRFPVDFISGGNPELQPESADTLTVGVVINPVAIPKLTLAVDYFNLEVSDTIGNINALEICFDGLNTGNVFCENIRRDQSGNIAELFEPFSNRGVLATTGIDTQLQYQLDLPASLALFADDARLRIETVWTYMMSNKFQQNIVTKVFDCAGYFGFPCEGGNLGSAFPKNRVTTNFDYLSGPLDIHLTWRWIDGARNAAPFDSADFGFPNPVLAVPSVPAYNYFDLGSSYRFSASWLARFGINNLLDKQPPQMANTTWANNTDTGMYDVFGQTFYLSLSMTH